MRVRCEKDVVTGLLILVFRILTDTVGCRPGYATNKQGETVGIDVIWSEWVDSGRWTRTDASISARSSVTGGRTVR
jgi:hypothetical protein